MDLSIIIVNYNTKDLTIGAIQSVMNAQTDFTYEVIVVDNHSTDGSVNAINDRFPDLTLVCNEENVGFSKANNQGINLAKGRYIGV